MSKIWKNNDIISSADAQRWEDKPSTQDLADLKDTIESGNVKSADKLKTAREIAITGNATGSAIFDGSQNINISTTIANASTSGRGLVQLSNATGSTKEDVAATSKAVSYKADLTYTQTELNKKADKSIAQMFKLTNDSGYAFPITGNLNSLTNAKTHYTSLNSENLPPHVNFNSYTKYIGRNEFNGIQINVGSHKERGKLNYRIQDDRNWSVWQQLATENDLSQKANIDKAQMYKLTRDNGDMKILKGTDVNNVYENGFYYVWNGENLPAHRLGWLLVFKRDNSKLTTQIYIDYYEESMFLRIAKENGWTEWVEIATTNDITATEAKLQKAIDLKSDKTYVDSADNTIKQSISSLDSRTTTNLNKKADKSVAQMWKLTYDNGTTKTTSERNIDNYKSTGLYYITGIRINGKSYNGYLEVAKSSSKWCKQVFTTHLDNLIFTRVFCDGRYWTSWRQLATTDYTWNRPVLENGWQNYGDGYQELEFSKDDTGLITLRGNIKNTQSALPGGMSIARLPKNVAPKNPLYFEIITGNYESGYVAIQASGEITTRGKVSKDWICLDGISYKI